MPSWIRSRRARPPHRAAPAAGLVALLALLAALPAPGAEPGIDVPPLGRPVFTDVTAAAGLGGFLHAGYLGPGNLDDPPAFFTEFTGPGACWLDADGDGWLDLYLVNGLHRTEPSKNAVQDPHGKLYRNSHDGTFADASAGSGADLRGVHQGCAAADYDNDGDADLYVTGHGGNTLLRNRGDGTFDNVTGAAGVRDAQCGDYPCWGSSVSWLDADRDGCLDLFVNHFTDYDPENPPPVNGPGPGQVNRFYRNLCDGTFADRTGAANLSHEKKDSWSSVAADFNNDGWPDLYVSNDGDANDLYLNDGDGTFTRKEGSAASDPRSGMGTAVGDFDHDGKLDIVTTNYVGQTNGIFQAAGDDYVDIGADAPFDDADPYSGWGTAWVDLHNDGHPDLVVANGLTEDYGVQEVRHPLLAYENLDGAGGWRSVRADLGADFQRELVARGAAFADYDNDGDVDVLVTEAGEAPTHLLRSDRGGGNFLTLDLRSLQPGVNRDAVGARVWVRAAGLDDQMRDKTAGDSYLGSSDPRLHFGLGTAEAADVEVRWPDGARQTWQGLPANAFLRLTQGEAQAEVLRALPLVRLGGPAEVQRLAPAAFAADVALPGGATLAGIAWDLGDGATASGPTASHAFGDVGEYVVRATASDTDGRAKTQAMRVRVWDRLAAQVQIDAPVFTPLEQPRGTVWVRFEDGTPVRNAEVTVVVARSSGHALVDAALEAGPFFLREVLGFVPFEFRGATGADGAFRFTVPHNLESPVAFLELEASHPGSYTATATGGARGSVFEAASATYEVGVPPVAVAV